MSLQSPLGKDSLKTVSPTEISAYLRSNGWTIHNYRAEQPGITFIKNDTNSCHDVFLPKRTDFADYSYRIQDILEELQAIEKRTAEKILYDIRYTSYDVLRFKVPHAASAIGELPLEGNFKLIDGAKEIISAATIVAGQTHAERKPFYARRTGAASDFLNRVRVAQSEVGSYILKMTIAIPPAVQQTLPLPEGQEAIMAADPFERKVTRTLMESLSGCITASDEAILSGTVDPLLSKYQFGINANLLSGIAKIGEIYETNDFEVLASWSGNRISPITTPRRASFSSDQMIFFKEAARILREHSPLDDYRLVGNVVKLEGENRNTAGRVTVAAAVEGKLKNVRISLDAPTYAVAYDAHGAGTTITCIGDLKRSGKIYTLENTRNFAVVVEDIE